MEWGKGRGARDKIHEYIVQHEEYSQYYIVTINGSIIYKYFKPLYYSTQTNLILQINYTSIKKILQMENFKSNWFWSWTICFRLSFSCLLTVKVRQQRFLEIARIKEQQYTLDLRDLISGRREAQLGMLYIHLDFFPYGNFWITVQRSRI